MVDLAQGVQLGALDRPEPEIRPIHWWQKLLELTTILRRIDERQANADTFRLAIDEKSPYNAEAVQLSVSAAYQTTAPVVITGFIAVSSGSAATLQIGDSQFPVNQGTTIQTGLTIIRRNAVASTLTATVAGVMYLEVMGYEQPRIVP